MPTQALGIGITPITQNTVFALPARRVIMFSPDAAVTFVQSNDVAFGVSVAVVLTNGQSELAGGFIKCTSANPTVISLRAV